MDKNSKKRGSFLLFFIEAIPLLVYGGLTVLSTALSVDKDLSLKGMWQQYGKVTKRHCPAEGISGAEPFH